jgi:hemolysin III
MTPGTAPPLAVAVLAPHYPSTAARRADFVVHLIGLTLFTLGGATLIGVALGFGRLDQIGVLGVYACGPLLMLAFSTAYNFADDRRRPALRRLDHAGIFVMIAASYTPFTTHALRGAWAWGMTSAIWVSAALGVLGKLLLPGLGRKIWVAVYLAIGWLALVAIKPMLASLSWVAVLLLAIGGLIYSSGVVFHINRRLKFSKAIWHGHVVAGAAVHWAAVLVGVVLAAPR